MLLRQTEEAPGRKRKLSVEPNTTKSPSPAAKRRKRGRPHRPGTPPKFWDNLSRLWLTPRGLREFDRRARLRNTHQQQTSSNPKNVGAPSLKRFARHGGPDLSAIRAYPEPNTSASYTQSMSSSQSRERKRDAEASSSTPPGKTLKTKESTAYDAAFEQNLVDSGIYIRSEYSVEPENLEQINGMLVKSRPSLSPSRFTREDFKKFRQVNDDVCTESDVMRKVFPRIIGDREIPSSGNVEFNNLAPLTDGTIAKDKPDYYEGSRPADLKRRVRDGLREYIVPSTDTSRPCLPNFFTELKGPRGSLNVEKRQACYDGAIGARGMHRLRAYVDSSTALDNNAYTIMATYAGGSGDGQLKLYTTHLTVSEDPERTVDYRMTQLRGWDMTDNPDSFRQGASALRNARDWAEKKRQELIDAANDTTQIVSNVNPSTSERSTEAASSQSTTVFS